MRSFDGIALELGERHEGHNRTAIDVGAGDTEAAVKASLLRTLTTCCAPGGPIGITMRPSGFSCCRSGGGTWSMPQVTMILSNGAISSQP